MVDDTELLRRYAEGRSEAAFAELVQRHLGLVYHAALRRSGGDTHRASDVTQTVFTALARDAAKLSRHTLLTGWLYATTRNAAIDVARTEQRRKNREQAAHVMHEISSPDSPPADWDRVRPVIDEVMDELGEHEREAVLLRFLEDQPFATVGQKLSVSEDAARMRVDRALDKMRTLLGHRGIASTTAALAATLAQEASAATPSGLAAAVTGTALAKAAAGGSATAASSVGAGKLLLALALVTTAASTAGLVVQYRINARLRDEMEDLRQQRREQAVASAENNRPRTAENSGAGGASGDLASLHAEIDRLKAELLAAKNAAMQDGAATNAPAAPTRTIPLQLLMPVEGRYVALFRQLNLTREQLNLLNNLLGEKQRIVEESIESLIKDGLDPEANIPGLRHTIATEQDLVNTKIRSQLGDEVYAKYQKYEQTLPQRNTIEQLEQSLRGSIAPLTEEQSDQMIDILAQTHEPEAKGGLGRILDGNATYHSRISAQTINLAASVLSEPQLRGLERLHQLQSGNGGR